MTSPKQNSSAIGFVRKCFTAPSGNIWPTNIPERMISVVARIDARALRKQNGDRKQVIKVQLINQRPGYIDDQLVAGQQEERAGENIPVDREIPIKDAAAP